MGASSGRPLRVGRDVGVPVRGMHLGGEEMCTETPGASSEEWSGSWSRSGGYRPGAHSRAHSTPLERSGVVGPAGQDADKLPHAGHTPGHPAITVEGREGHGARWSASLVPTRTLSGRGGIENASGWSRVAAMGRATGQQGVDRKETISGCLEWPALSASGASVEKTSMRLVWLFRGSWTEPGEGSSSCSRSAWCEKPTGGAPRS